MAFAQDAADRVVFMADGAIVEVAPPKEFFTNPKNERLQDFLRRTISREE
jgi:ABC-type polar amino acid transport system ATPase subunit